MGLNDTPVSERIHIAFFGCRNAGKSSLMNAVTGQEAAVVSDVKGTTTDPVYKTMELLPAGPVVMIDTPGLDDEGTLGEMRIEKALEVLRKTDLAVVVTDATAGYRAEDRVVLEKIAEAKIPFIEVVNKADLTENAEKKDGIFYVSAVTKQGINELKERIAALALKSADEKEKPIVSDLIPANSLVILVVPIDKAAPKGRLILPQQQVIRDLLDNGNIPLVVRDSELKKVIDEYGDKTALVITDSQAFAFVSRIVPENIPLTSFSILFSRYKGELDTQLEGVRAIDSLCDGDTILISEGCTHHRQCGDIGTQKLPALIRKYTGKNILFRTTSGKEFPTDLVPYKAVVHCGGCMLNEKEMKARIDISVSAGVPVTNYGMVLAYCNGILKRSVAPLGINL